MIGLRTSFGRTLKRFQRDYFLSNFHKLKIGPIRQYTNLQTLGLFQFFIRKQLSFLPPTEQPSKFVHVQHFNFTVYSILLLFARGTEVKKSISTNETSCSHHLSGIDFCENCTLSFLVLECISNTLASIHLFPPNDTSTSDPTEGSNESSTASSEVLAV